MGDDAFSPLAPGWFEIMFGVVALLIVTIIVLTVVMAVRNIRALQRAGLDPSTVQADLVTRLAHSDVLAPAQSLEARLAELADLRARGVISDEEHTAARAAVLGT